jgi:TolB-like protein/DNA-binding SARP family transcriptional activator
MAALTVHLLGGFEARLDAGAAIQFPTRKARALLAYLALCPGRAHSRDEVADLLWSTRDDEQARGSLRRTLSDLRKSLGDPDWLIADGDMLSLEPAGVAVDVAAFEQLANDGAPAALEEAAALYKADLLAGFGLPEQPFEEWLRAERERLRDLALRTLARLLAHHEAAGATERAIETAQRLLALDPVNEATHRALMSLYAREGRRGDALRQYERCRDLLRETLGIAPDPATEELHRVLQNPGALPAAPTRAQPERREEPGPLSDKPAIAVLPFSNLSGDPEQEYFADGLVEDIIGALSRISALWVIARASTFSYKGKPTDVKQVARELGVRYVMEGSVRRSGDRLRVTAQLADALTGHQVWAERYDRPLADLFEIQDQITRSVAATTETQILLAEGQAIAEAWPTGLKANDFKARDLVTRAWSRLYDETPDAAAEASDLVEEALRLNPSYPRAHWLRATVLFSRLWNGVVSRDAKNMALAMELARTALRLAPRDELAHLLMAWAWEYCASGRLEDAIAECERGLEINPNCSLIHANLGFALAALGRSRESIEASRLALQLNPRDPSNFWRHYAIAVAHFAAEDFPAALQQAKKTALSRPHLQSGIIWAAASAALGDRGEAHAALEYCLAQRPDLTVGAVVPHFMLRFARDADHERLLALLRKAGLPE